MRILALSLEKNNATRRQVVGLSRALQKRLGVEETDIEALQVKIPDKAVTLPNNTIVTWTKPLDADQLKDAGLIGQYDMIIACRPEVAAVAIGYKKLHPDTLIVAIQDPNDKTGTYNFDRTDFDLIVKQAQEKVTGPNVISSLLPLHDLTPETLAQWREEGLAKFPHYKTRPVSVVFIGGSDEHVSLNTQDFAKFGADIADLARITGDVFVLSSRRTSEDQKAAFKAAVGDVLIDPTQNNEVQTWKPRVFFDHPDLSYDQALGIGTNFISDAGSGSMGAEVEFTGMPWTFYHYRGTLDDHPQMSVWPAVKVAQFPMFGPPQDVGSADEAPEIAGKIIELLRLPEKRELAGPASA